jgi:hypothetical protein
MNELEQDMADAREKGLALSVDGATGQGRSGGLAGKEEPEEIESEARPRD